MRTYECGVAYVAAAIETDLKERNFSLRRTQISGLADLAASALACGSANTAEWINVLPRQCDMKSRERYISRFLANKHISNVEVMAGFIPELIEMQAQQGMTVVIMLDQSKVIDNFECLMMSLRVGERAIPIAWRTVETKGAIGFDIQQELLNDVLKCIPDGANILLAADRFYGTRALVQWCKDNSWQYRIRLKGNTIFEYEGMRVSPNEAMECKMDALIGVKFNKSECVTNIGILWEEGHDEPWFIAMDCVPSKHRILDYGMRWGIECLFSDFKSRGFDVNKTHLKHADRIDRLILILAIATYWAVSSGMKPEESKTKHTKKNSIGQ